MDVPRYAQVGFVVVILISTVLYGKNTLQTDTDMHSISQTDSKNLQGEKTSETSTSERALSIQATAILPIKNIVTSTEVKHSIPLEEIRQGCSRQDCIPSVDDPEFIPTQKALDVVAPEQIGIALSYKGVDRFCPFSMLVTKEIVNDVVAGDPLLITYCPLCGTGIVYDRTVDGVVYEFGVSGLLWQSNLLMYNRDASITNRNLWSQVLGEAVVGERTGTPLAMIPSDIMQFSVWAAQNPQGEVLNTGSQRDPYSGEYFAVAERFAPNFDSATSPLVPDAYVYGIEVDGAFKAYPRDLLSLGEIHDMINGEEITITNSNGRVTFVTQAGAHLSDVEGFWFSWVAAHPQTAVWSK